MPETTTKEAQAPALEDTRPLKTYRFLRGVHSDKTFEPVSLVEIEGVDRSETPHIFYPGDVIRCRKDLEKQNNPVDKRVERLNEFEPINALPAEDALSKLTIEELKAVAEREEISLGEVTRKADILQTIREGLASAAAIA